MKHATNIVTAARADALFTSDLSAHSEPSRAEVTDAIQRAVRAHGGCRGCAIEVVGEYGEHPESAAQRIRWALAMVRRP